MDSFLLSELRLRGALTQAPSEGLQITSFICFCRLLNSEAFFFHADDDDDDDDIVRCSNNKFGAPSAFRGLEH